MKPTDDLREEHKAVKLMLRILDGICMDIESGRSVKQENLQGLVEFMRVFVDKCHHTKEEAYLFPEIEKSEISGSKELITSLKNEHEERRQYVSRIEQIVSKKEEHREISTMAENSRVYIQLLTLHIDKEDNKLFPMADTDLTHTVQENLLKSFEIVENDVISHEKHEEFHKWLHTRGEIYAKPR